LILDRHTLILQFIIVDEAGTAASAALTQQMVPF
jgi:hypothetical protein